MDRSVCSYHLDYVQWRSLYHDAFFQSEKDILEHNASSASENNLLIQIYPFVLRITSSKISQWIKANL